MDWNLEQALAYYRRQGAPGDQTALVSLLKEVQQEFGCVPQWFVGEMAREYGIKESYLLAVVKRIPSLRLENTHLLEVCGGPNCRASLAPFIEKTYGKNPREFTLKISGCMRMCGKGPNIKWDGRLYNGADEALIRRLVEGKDNDNSGTYVPGNF